MTNTTTYEKYFANMGQAAKVAAEVLNETSTEKKNIVLLTIAEGLINGQEEILKANQKDCEEAEANGLRQIMMDRLRLTAERIEQIALGVKQVAELPDPIGRTLEEFDRPNGLHIKKVSVPMGVIAMIYEARPNVTADAAALCLKTGNAVILRGGKEAMHSNQAIVKIMQEAAVKAGLPREVIQLVEITDRDAVSVLLKQRSYIDLVIPRGSAGLIQRIVTESSIPVIETGSGVCHVYVDEFADPAIVVPILINSKVQRPSVCNSAETVLIHKNIKEQLLPAILQALHDNQVEVRGDKAVVAADQLVKPASAEDWATEYNDLTISAGIVDSVEEAVAHINRYGTKHSECILTEDAERAAYFMNAVDASTVYVNASTRFTDGFEFGLGAEIGISTQKTHARGPMGLEALTSYKYLVFGHGQIRD